MSTDETSSFDPKPLPPDETQNFGCEGRLDEVVAAYLRAVHAGQAPDPQEWVARYPELAPKLAEFFADRDRMERLAQSIRATALAPRAGTHVRYLGDYELLEELGRGGMGVVYKARQISLKRLVALKMILAGSHASPSELARFRAETEAVARLQHPHIVQIYEIGEHEGHPYAALEFVKGGSLDKKLAGTPQPARSAAQLLELLARAIHAAHQRGIVHRDLKPANVLLAPGDSLVGVPLSSGPESGRYEPKISDFGLAKLLHGDAELASGSGAPTVSGSILGTPSYMAPEQAAGKTKEIGPAADVYALGVILYELLTGRPPFRAESPLDTLAQVISQEPVSPRQLLPKLPRDLETICLKCLEKEPRKRYLTAEALADDLRRFLDRRPIQARPVGALERGWRWCRRNPARAVAAGVGVLSLLVILVGGWWFNRRLQEHLRQTEAAERQLQISLTREAAERLDGDLKQLAAIPQLMAATLALRADWTEKQLEAWMREALRKDSRVFGICVAFEPFQFDRGQEDFALYVCRAREAPRRLTAKRLTFPEYDPPYRQWPWYSQPKEQRRALWSEPFLDRGGGNVPMLTYSVPLERHGQVVGVVTADLSLDYFKVMRAWLAELRVGREGYAFVVSSTGTFISHPNSTYRLPKKITEVKEFQADEDLQALTQQMLRGETGRLTAIDPWTGRRSAFLFATVPSAGWSLAVVVENGHQPR